MATIRVSPRTIRPSSLKPSGSRARTTSRPAAFEGSDGYSYTAEVVTDTTGDPAAPYAAYVLFVRWARIGAQSPAGHLETEYLETGTSEEDTRRRVADLRLSDVKQALDAL